MIQHAMSRAIKAHTVSSTRKKRHNIFVLEDSIMISQIMNCYICKWKIDDVRWYLCKLTLRRSFHRQKIFSCINLETQHENEGFPSILARYNLFQFLVLIVKRWHSWLISSDNYKKANSFLGSDDSLTPCLSVQAV